MSARISLSRRFPVFAPLRQVSFLLPLFVLLPLSCVFLFPLRFIASTFVLMFRKYLYKNKDRKCDNYKVKYRLENVPYRPRLRQTRFLAFASTITISARQVRAFRECVVSGGIRISFTSDETDFAERRAHNHADSHVNDVSAGYKLLETFHSRAFFDFSTALFFSFYPLLLFGIYLLFYPGQTQYRKEFLLLSFLPSRYR